MGVPRRLGTLLAVGTAVCGCTAVVALSPVIRARNVETAYAVTCVVLFGCIGMLFYPWLAAALFGASPVHAGVFLGTSIHDTSQVVGSALDLFAAARRAGRAFGRERDEDAAQPVDRDPDSGGGVADARRGTGAGGHGCRRRRRGLCRSSSSRSSLFVLFRTLGDSVFGGETWRAALAASQTGAELLLVCGMAAVGLNVPFAQMWLIGWRPLASGMLIAVLVGACSLTVTLLMQRFFA